MRDMRHVVNKTQQSHTSTGLAVQLVKGNTERTSVLSGSLGWSIFSACSRLRSLRSASAVSCVVTEPCVAQFLLRGFAPFCGVIRDFPAPDIESASRRFFCC